MEKKRRPRRSLTPREKAFAENYMITGSVFEAGCAAGYSLPPHYQARAGRSGYAPGEWYRVLYRPLVQEYMKELHERENADRIAQATEVLGFLTDVMRGNVKDNDALRMKAAELLGKRHALFTDKVEQKTDTVIEVKLED